VHAPALPSPRCSRGVVLLILLLALGLRLGWGLTRPVDADAINALPDQREYLALANALNQDGRLAMADPRFNDLVYAFRMPGYPAFGAMLGADVRLIRVGQAIADVSTVLATLWLARRWLGPVPSYLAALFVALDPIYIYFSGLILSETLFASMLTWGIACLVHGAPFSARATRGRHALWVLGTVLLLASIYVRPSALPLPVLVVGVALAHAFRSAGFKAGRRMPTLTITLLATFAVLVPWALRNNAVLGTPLFTTTNDGFTLYDGLNPDADGSSDQSWVERLPLLTNLSESQRSAYLKARALEWAQAHPVRVMRLAVAKVGRTWSTVPLSAEYGSRRHYVIGAACHAVPMMLLALLGLFNRAMPRRARLLLVTPALLITLTHALSVGSLRYRMPVHTQLAVLAGMAVAMRWQDPERAR
jgi:hypothetical protein